MLGKILFAVFMVFLAYVPATVANEVCSLRVDPGMCTEYVRMYFFNPTIRRCGLFHYGGCGGNENRFRTLAECEATCQIAVCQLPKVSGPCEAIISSWYFDVNSCSCRSFVYGGCMGNENRFQTEAECSNVCGIYPCNGCVDPLQIGPCRAAVPRWFYNDTSMSCQEFSWGGCQPNGNNFVDSATCKRACRYSCTLPLDRGTKELPKIRRWYYNQKRNRCRRFMWGGMGEEVNTNNFMSRRICRRTCKELI